MNDPFQLSQAMRMALALAALTSLMACEAREVVLPLQEPPQPGPEEVITPEDPQASDPPTLKNNTASTPDTILALLESARDLAERGQEQRARLKYKQVLLLNPGNVTALEGLAESHARTDEPRKAEAYYKKLLKTDGRHIKTLYTLSHMLRDQGRVTEALSFSEALTAIIQSDANALALHGTLLLEAERLPEAITFLERALRQGEGMPDAMNNLANARARQGQPQLAEPLYEELIALDPKNPDTHYNLGTALQAQEKYKEALAAYRECLELNAGHPQANEAYEALMKWARETRAARRQ